MPTFKQRMVKLERSHRAACKRLRAGGKFMEILEPEECMLSYGRYPNRNLHSWISKRGVVSHMVVDDNMDEVIAPTVRRNSIDEVLRKHYNDNVSRTKTIAALRALGIVPKDVKALLREADEKMASPV